MLKTLNRKLNKKNLHLPGAIFWVWGVSFAVTLIFALYSWFIDNKDHVEFMGTALYLINGNGWVNPLKIIYNFDAPAPVPAFAFRGAFYPLILALFLKISPHVLSLKIFNALLASLTAPIAFVLFKRFYSARSAFFGALFFFTTPGWLVVAKTPWSEPLVCLMWLVPLACWFLISPSTGQALLTGFVAILAWGTKPQLGFFFPLLGLSLLILSGWKKFIQNRLFWMGTLTFYLGTGLIKLFYHHYSDLWPYFAYQTWLRSESNAAALHFQTDFSQSVMAFFISHYRPIIDLILSNISIFFKMLFSGYYFFCVPLFPLGLYFWLRQKRKSVFSTLLWLSSVSFILLNWALWSLTDVTRSYLLPLLLIHFAVIALIEEKFPRFFMPLMYGLLILIIPLRLQIFSAQKSIYKNDARILLLPEMERNYGPHCAELSGKNIAAFNGWNAFSICGSPVNILPDDITSEAVLSEFIAREKIGVILTTNNHPELDVINHSTQLKPIFSFTLSNGWAVNAFSTLFQETKALTIKPVPIYPLLLEEINRIKSLSEVK